MSTSEYIAPTGPSKVLQEFQALAQQLAKVNKQFFTEKSLNSFEHSRQREDALIKAVEAMAICYGTKLRSIISINSRGEISLVCDDSRGYGAGFASVLSSFHTRTGTVSRKSPVLPESTWSYMNHFDAEAMVFSMDSFLKTLL